MLLTAALFSASLQPIDASAACAPRPAASASPAPEPPLYSMADDIYTRDRDATFYYSFRSESDGSAAAKSEIRYARNLWNTCAQLQIRLPFITRYPAAASAQSPQANPYSGFGNAELRYSYNVASAAFDHSIEVGAAFPTASNGVDSLDTQLKLIYATKWRWRDGSIVYINEYDQTIIRPPGANYTSFYEGKVSLPNYAFVDSPDMRGLKVSAFYDYRFLFSNGGLYRSALGGIVNGNVNDVALNFVDTWGLGQSGLWRYKVEATATARLNF